MVDVNSFSFYSTAVFAGLMDFVSAEDLAQAIDMSIIGAGSQRLSWCLSNVVSGHLFLLTGGIAILKGIQGMKGDVF